MPKVSTSPASIRELKDLTRLIQRAPGFPEVLASLKNGRGATLDGAWGSAGPLATAALGLHAPRTLVIALAHVGDVDDFRDDVATFAGVAPEVFPAWDRLPREAGAGDEVFGRRLRVVRRLAGPSPPRFVVAPLQALVQPVPTAEALARSSRTVRVGDSLAVEGLTAWLAGRGMARAEVVEVPGEFSLRGGILDIYPPDASEPVRVEFFGDDVESIRPFDPETQRSLDRWDSVTLTASTSFDAPGDLGHAADSFPEGTWVALVEPNDLREEGKHYFARIDDPRGLFSVESTLARLVKFPSIAVSTLAADSLETTCHLRVESVERFSGELGKVKAELDGASGGDGVLIACHNAAEVERLREVFADTEIDRSGRLSLTVGRVRSGFHLIDARTLVIGDHELFARADVRRPATRRRYESRAIDSFLDLNEGDLVVHVNHGIARYRGLQMVDRTAEHAEETLLLEFAEGTKMFVPIAKIDLVQKYVGGGKAEPSLSKVGSSAWEKRKKRVADAVVDLAAELIDIQAARASEPGIAYPAEDSHWMAEFEAAFPYQETPDQLSAIDAIKRDMAQPRPMDRLICGDVGYGKTEVAMRAAFKAVDAGKQVAVLVPTTVLAEQHHRSFSARMAEFPFAIEVVNRFRSKAEIKDVLNRTKTGGVDILIGTHRLVQKDVAFRDLGLVVIDEEQRFGVEDKEWLKSLRATVDVLTLSATPIPRTLHMSLLGIRDISNLETPPPTARRSRPASSAGTTRPSRGPSTASSTATARSTSSTTGSTTSGRSPTASGRSSPRRGSRSRTARWGARLWSGRCSRSSAANSTSSSPPRSSRAAWTSPTSTRSSSTRPTSTAWPTSTSSADASAGTSTAPTPTCSWNRTGRSRPTRSSGSRRSRSSPSWGPGSRSPCATWRSGAPATSSGPSSRGTSRASATSCIARCSNRPCGP